MLFLIISAGCFILVSIVNNFRLFSQTAYILQFLWAMMILSFPAGVVKLNTPSRTERLFQKEETRVVGIIHPIYGAASITWSRARFWAMSSAACGCSSKKKPQHIWQVFTWFYGLFCTYLHSAAPYATFLLPSFFFFFFLPVLQSLF